jgi:Spy/CpxP family protein refolding chaperone
MRRRVLGLAVLGFGLVASSAFAQAPAQGQAQPERPRRSRGGPSDRQRGGRMSVDQQMEQLTKALQLTADQQEKVRKLLTDYGEKMREMFRSGGAQGQGQGQAQGAQDNRTKMRELFTELRAARQANDEAKVKELEAKLQELRNNSPMGQARQKMLSDIEALLTPEQKEKWPKVRDEVFGFGGGTGSLESDPRALMGALRSLNLPQDKSSKMRELFQDYRTRSQSAQTDEERKTLAKDLYDKVMAELSPEQQAKLKEYRPGSSRGGAPGSDRGQGRSRRSRGQGGGATPATPQQ